MDGEGAKQGEASGVAVEEEQPKVEKMQELRKSLADRIRAKAAIQEKSKPQENTALKSPTAKTREIVKDQLRHQHNRLILGDLNEAPDQEIMEELEEEEEEEEIEDLDEELKENPIAKACVESLKGESIDPDMSIEEIEKKMYQKVVEMRLSEDLEEIKNIIRVITGQWRSGSFKHSVQGNDSLEKAFEGDSKERKELEEKRKMRQQRKLKKIEERAREISSQTITQLVERAMWIKAGQSDSASASDRIRGEIAQTSKSDPRLEVLERLEMVAFEKEMQQRAALKQKREGQRVNRMKLASSPLRSPDAPVPIGFKGTDFKRKTLPFAFSFTATSAGNQRQPVKKKAEVSAPQPNEELEAFLSRNF